MTIEVWSWPTPNGHKVHVALEELGLPYEVIPVDIGAGEQFRPEFLAITPNHRIPAIVDPEPGFPVPGDGKLRLFESGAILIHLAEKAGRLIPEDRAGRALCLQWLMFQMGGVGPMFGQYNHFENYAPEPLPYARQRYGREVRRLYGVLEKRLSEAEHLAGEYSIADVATYPWARNPERRGVEAAEFPAVSRWLAAVGERPAVQRGLAVLSERRRPGPLDEHQRDVLFGATQFARR